MTTTTIRQADLIESVAAALQNPHEGRMEKIITRIANVYPARAGDPNVAAIRAIPVQLAVLITICNIPLSEMRKSRHISGKSIVNCEAVM